MRVVRSVTESTGGRFGHNEGGAMTKVGTEGKREGQGGEEKEGGKGEKDREKKNSRV